MMMQISFFDLNPDLFNESKSKKCIPKESKGIVLRRRVGRPTKEEAAAKMKVRIYPVPEVNEEILIRQRVLDRYSAYKEWRGQVLDKTSNCVLVKLMNGFRECFQINEFKYGLLSYEKIS